MLNSILKNKGERMTPTFKEEFKITSEITSCKKKCRCSHTQYVPKRKDKEFDICTHCNGRLYRDDEKQQLYNKKRDKEEFLYQMRKVLKYETEKTIF